MKKEKQPKIVYFEDELNDDFAGTKINTKVVDSKFKFVHKNPVWTFFANAIYYVLVSPIVLFYTKCILHVKFVNKKAVKPLQKKKERYYLYGNHTGVIDAFTPNIISLPTRNKLIVGADSVSIKGLKNLLQMMGVVPIPTGTNGMREFLQAIDYYNKKYNITIYPEAHIWPYYTGVRNFPDTSFAYPVKHGSPVVAFFTAYSKPKGFMKCFRKANITVYVSDPIYPNTNLPKKEAQKELRDKVYAFMKECSEKHSTYEVVTYKHISEKSQSEETHD